MDGIAQKGYREMATTSGPGALARLMGPAVLLRLEGVVLLALSVFLYDRHDGGWLMFALLLLAPDLSMLGYLVGPRAGAAIYNAFHTYAFPAALGVLGLVCEIVPFGRTV